MNQILFTGEEVINNKRVEKQKKTLPISGIVIFFAISIIILGICIIAGSMYGKQQINSAAEAKIQPEISVRRNDDNNTIEINVTHIRGIKNVAYRWNDEEEIVIETNNSKNVNEVIDLIGGENTLKISVTEENGNIKNFEKTFVAGNIPEIKIEGVTNGIKVIATSEEIIDLVQYSWDDGELKKIQVGQNKYEGIINVPSGKHVLKLEVIDINGLTANIEQEVVGDTEPTLTIKPKLVDGNAAFSISAEDDENIKTITIIHNGGEPQVITVNEKTYYKDLIMTSGETNTLVVTVTNVNDLQKTLKVKFDNIRR